jgi:hypothetical protein
MWHCAVQAFRLSRGHQETLPTCEEQCGAVMAYGPALEKTAARDAMRRHPGQLLQRERMQWMAIGRSVPAMVIIR